MPIICPSCGSSYAVSAAFRDGADGDPPARRVRCRTCRTIFLATFCPDDDRQQDAERAIAEARGFRAARLGTILGGGGLGLAAGAFAALLAVPGGVDRLAADPRLPGALSAGIARLPSSGLPFLAPPQSPLELVGDAVRHALPEGRAAFEVSGAIINPTADARRTPAIEIRLIASDGRTLERRTVRADTPTIPAGGRLDFSSVALNAPPEATRVAFALRPDPLERF